MKKISVNIPKVKSADKWAGSPSSPKREQPAGPMKRLTIDIPQNLHRRVKRGCGDEGITIADVIREFLEKRFPD